MVPVIEQTIGVVWNNLKFAWFIWLWWKFKWRKYINVVVLISIILEQQTSRLTIFLNQLEQLHGQE